MKIRVMTINYYDGVYNLWINTPGMDLNTTDDSREDLVYRNKNIHALERIDT